MSKLKVLITSPSIDTKNNVSGIANLTKLIIENNSDVDYDLFVAGRKDNERRGIFWVIKQILVVAKFYKKLNSREIALAHINMPLGAISIVRDAFFVLLCNLKRKNHIIHIHGGRYSKNQNIPSYLKFLVKYSLKKADHVIVLGKEELSFLQEFYHVNNKKITVLQNSVSVPESLSKKINEKGTKNLLYLGRIDKDKGLPEILQALLALSKSIDFILHIAGDGDDKEWFLKECKDQLGNKAKYHGIVSGVEKLQLLEISHVFLLPSYFEGLPVALLEAMAYGLVSIVTPVGSIPELVKDNHNGLIVPIKDAKSIVEKIEFLINNPHEIKRLGVNAYNTIKSDYDLEVYIQKLNTIYKAITI